MTSNQINWAKVQEEARSNRENELIKHVANAIAAQGNTIAMRNAETNALNANINAMNARTRENEYWETVRSNFAREAEQRRTNMANENIKYSQLVETQRSNLASEAITSRYNEQRISQGEASLWGESQKRHTEEYKAYEAARHNRVEEQIETRKTNQGAVKTIVEGFGRVLGTLGTAIGILA